MPVFSTILSGSKELHLTGSASFLAPSLGVVAEFKDTGGNGRTRIYDEQFHIDYAANSVASAPLIVLSKTRGTLASPTPPNDADVLGEIRWDGYDTASSKSVRIVGKAAGAHGGSSTDSPGKLEIYTCPDGSGTPAKALTVESDQSVTFEGNTINDSGVAAALSFDGNQNVSLPKAGNVSLTIGTDDDGNDRSIVFGHSTLKSRIGIDDDQDVFAINTDLNFEAENDLEIDASGNVTLGNGSLYVDGEVWGKGTSQLKLRSNSDVIVMIDADNDGANKFKVNTSSDTTKFSVDESGNVDVAGNLQMDSGQYIESVDASSSDLNLRATGNVGFWIDSDGDVGNKSFYIMTGSNTNTNDAVFRMNENGNLTITGDIELGGNDIKNSDGEATITLDADQRVGIGGISPTYKLDVDGDIRIRGNDIRDNSGNVAIQFDGSANTTVSNALSSGGNITAGSGNFIAASGQGLAIRAPNNATVYIDTEEAGGASKTFKVAAGPHTGATDMLSVDESGNMDLTGDLTVTGGDIIASDDEIALYLSGSGNVAVKANLTVHSGSIKSNDGTTALYLSGSGDVGIARNITAWGGGINASDGNAIYLSGSGDVGIARDLTLWGNSLNASGSSGAINVEGQLTARDGMPTSTSVCVNSGTPSGMDDRWFKIATLGSGVVNQKQAKTNILVTMVGPEISSTYDANDTFLLSVSFNPSSVGSPWYNEEGTGILVDSWEGVGDMEGFNPQDSVALTFSNSSMPGVVELWIQAKESHRTIYTSILGGNTLVTGDYTSPGGGFELLSGQSADASITSLGQEVYGRWMSKSFDDVHISKIYSDFVSGGNQVLSFSGSNINSNPTNPVSIMATGNGVIPQLNITSRATLQNSGPEFNMRKYASDGTLATGENLGEIKFLAATGSAPHGFDTVSYGLAAEIMAELGTGTWEDTTSNPGRLSFNVTADGATAVTTRMTIDSDGGVDFTPNGEVKISKVAGSGASAQYPLSVANGAGSYSAHQIWVANADASGTSRPGWGIYHQDDGKLGIGQAYNDISLEFDTSGYATFEGGSIRIGGSTIQSSANLNLNSDANVYFKINADGGDGSERFGWYDNSTERMTLSRGGNLEVDGTITNLSGDITAADDIIATDDVRAAGVTSLNTTDCRISTTTGQIYYYSSTRKVKELITNSTTGLTEILQLQPVTYERKAARGILEVGLIAEDVYAAIGEDYVILGPDYAFDNDGQRIRNEDKTWQLNSENEVPLDWDHRSIVTALIGAVRDLKEENDALAARIAVLENS